MTADELEDSIASYFEARESDAGLEPEVWAQRFGDAAPKVLMGIRTSLEVMGLFAQGGGAMLPTAIGPYEVLRELGRGGMGVVYDVARDGQRFALKLLPLALASAERALERFRREVQILKRLEHPGIVRFQDAGTDVAGPYLVMELLRGRTLDSMVNALDRRTAVTLVRDLALGLHAAHEAGALHRDVKPSNVFVRDDGTPVLIDFGLVADASLSTLTTAGEILGTPRYMAPEQVRGEPADARTDVYGLGTVLYEVLCRRPVQRDGTRASVMRAISRGRHPTPGSVARGVPLALDFITEKALSHRPSARYPSARALAVDLDRWLGGRPVAGRGTRSWFRVRTWVSSHPRIASCCLLFLVCCSAWIWWPRGSTPPASKRPLIHAAFRAFLERDADRARRLLGSVLDAADLPLEVRLLRRLLEPGRVEEEAPPWTVALRHVVAGEDREARRVLRTLGKDDAAAGVLGDWITGVAFRRTEADRALACLRRVGEVLGTLDPLALPLAEALISKDQSEEAVQWARRATASWPRDRRAWRVLSEALLKHSEHAESLVALDTYLALEGDITSPDRRFQAAVLERNGRREEARGVLRDVIEQDPNDGPAWQELAESCDTDHLVKEAAHAYEQAVRLRPSNIRASLFFANFLLGGDRARCVACAQAYETHPEFVRPERARELLIAALKQAQGRVGNHAPIFLDLALKLPDRTFFIDALTELLEGTEPSENPKGFHLLRELQQRSGLPGR